MSATLQGHQAQAEALKNAIGANAQAATAVETQLAGVNTDASHLSELLAKIAGLTTVEPASTDSELSQAKAELSQCHTRVTGFVKTFGEVKAELQTAKENSQKLQQTLKGTSDQHTAVKTQLGSHETEAGTLVSNLKTHAEKINIDQLPSNGGASVTNDGTVGSTSTQERDVTPHTTDLTNGRTNDQAHPEHADSMAQHSNTESDVMKKEADKPVPVEQVKVKEPCQAAHAAMKSVTDAIKPLETRYCKAQKRSISKPTMADLHVQRITAVTDREHARQATVAEQCNRITEMATNEKAKLGSSSITSCDLLEAAVNGPGGIKTAFDLSNSDLKNAISH